MLQSQTVRLWRCSSTLSHVESATLVKCLFANGMLLDQRGRLLPTRGLQVRGFTHGYCAHQLAIANVVNIEVYTVCIWSMHVPLSCNRCCDQSTVWSIASAP
jgi:hypothetical protein